MVILALDGSTKSTGWAIFENTTLINYGCITAGSTDLIKRISIMVDGLDDVLSKNPAIEKIIMEEVRPEQGLQNIKTHKALMYLQAAIAFLVHERYPKVTIEYVYPSSWRKACGIKTGSGVRRESLKPQDIAFVRKNYNVDVNDDEADAICIGHAQANVFDNELNWGE